MHAPLLALFSLGPAHHPPVDELPIDAWIVRVEDLSAINLRDRIVGAEGIERFCDPALGGPTRARFGYEDDLGRISLWLEDGVMTTLIEKRAAAVGAFRGEFYVRSMESMDERLAEADDEGGRR